MPLTMAPDAPRCRDDSDQMFIDLAVAGNADILLTRDRDLLTMALDTTFRILDDREAQHELTANG